MTRDLKLGLRIEYKNSHYSEKLRLLVRVITVAISIDCVDVKLVLDPSAQPFCFADTGPKTTKH